MLSLLRLRNDAWYLLACIWLVLGEVSAVGEVVWAVNCGGEGHTDMHGIRYQRDPLSTGIPSDYGKSMVIQRVVTQDQLLYQTERYHTATFSYDIPIKDDGEYVLVLKFSEVWFTAPNQKVFDVQLNGEHTVVEGLDIYSKVGRGTGHDEIIPFSVKKGEVRVNGERSPVDEGRITVDFVKGDRDNPKINAMYLMKGSVDDVPMLPPIPGGDRKEPDILEEEDEEVEEVADKKSKKARPSSPKVQDPYASDDTGSMMLPVFVSIGAFIPLLFCLCKL